MGEEDQLAVEKKEQERVVIVNDFLSKNRIYAFNRPRNPAYPELREANPLQKQLIEAWENPKYKVFTYSGANRIGKTTSLVIIALSVLFGEWPWSGKKFTFPHKEPRKVRLVGQGWETHIKAVLIPELEFWWPGNRRVTKKKNNQGVDYFWKDERSGSTLEILSSAQASDIAEGWKGDLVGYDEPPTRDMRVACARGLIDRQGRELFCMTLLKEAWIHREVVKAKLANGEIDPTVINLNGDISVNVGYGLTQAGVDQFAKTLTEDEKQARLSGKPSYMSSLVCPRFQRELHIKDRFKIPLDALVDISIDFHPSKPWAINFLATLKNNFKYICEEMKERGNPKYIAEAIVRKIRENDYRVNSITIDPLSKGDENNDETVFAIMSRVLASYGHTLDVASKDKDNGIAILNNLLWTENEMPALYFFKDCIHTIEELENWMYDPDTLKPAKKDDDFCEVTYRNCLKNTEWFPEYTGELAGKSVIL